MKTSIMAIVVISILIGLIVLLNGLGAPETKYVTPGSNSTVLYFDSIQDFGGRLELFIKEHPELKVVSVAPLDNAAYGSTRGYWVVVEKR